MSPNRPPRLPSFTYFGMHRYFVTICTSGRGTIFATSESVEPVLRQLLRSAGTCSFDVFAYCFMPDHLHVLLVAASDDSSLQECVRRFKQMSGFDYRRLTGSALWQAGYFERVLRDDEENGAVARYILENPVRAGLTRRFQDYPFSGSQQFTLQQLAELWSQPGRRV